MPPLHARIPTALARAIAWLSAFCGLLMLAALAIRVFPLEMNTAWLAMLAIGGVVLGTVVAIPRLEKKAAFLRIIGAAFPLCWGVALLAAGFLLDEPVWCALVRLFGGTALLIISGGVAANADWGLRAGASLAWLQVLFQYGTIIALAAIDRPMERSQETAFITTVLQLLLFTLLLHLYSQLDSARSSGSTAGNHHGRNSVMLIGSLVGLGAGWTLDWADVPWVLVASGSVAMVFGLAWWLAGTMNDPVPMNAVRIRIPATRWSTAAGRMATCLFATFGATIVIVPAVFTAIRRGLLLSIPFALSAIIPLLGIGLALGLARECFRARRQRIVADAAGFCILSCGQSRYVPYFDCAWGELRRTLWGVELVLRTPGFQQIVAYPLLDAGSVLAAARALRRCARARGQGPQLSGRFISRPHGSSLLVWIRGIQDQVRGGPYGSRVPEADVLLRLLEDVTCPVDEKAAAAVALVTLGSDLRAEGTPPLVTVAAGLAGADVRMEQAIEFLDEEDRQEVRRSLGLSHPRRLA